MSEFVEKLIIDDSQAVKALSNTKNLAAETGKEFEKLNDTTKKAGQAIGNEVKEGNDKAKKAITDTTKELKKQDSQILETVKNYRVFGVSINDIKDKLDEAKTYLNDFRSGLRSSASDTSVQTGATDKLSGALTRKGVVIKNVIGALKLLKVALISTGIGALVVALGSMISFLKTSQEGMNRLSVVSAQASAIFDVLKDDVNAFGKALLDAINRGELLQFGMDALTKRTKAFTDVLTAPISGDNIFEKYLDLATRSGRAVLGLVTGLNQVEQAEKKIELARIANAAKAIELMNQALIHYNRNVAISAAQMMAQLREQQEIATDDKNSYQERFAAIRKASQLEQKMTDDKIKAAQIEYNLLVEKNKLDKDDSNAEMQAEADLLIKIAELKQQSATIGRKLTSTENKLYEEALNKLTGIKDALFDMGVQTKIISEQEEFELVQQKQVDLLKEYITDLKELGQLFGVDISKEAAIAEQAIESMVERTFQKEIKTIPTITTKGITIKSTQAPEYDPEGKKIELPDDMFELENVTDFSSLLKESIDAIFEGEIKLDPDKMREFLEGAGALVGEFASIMEEATQVQLDQIDKQLESLDKRKAKLEDDLSEEQALFKEGLANNYAAKKEEVDKLLAEEERLNAEKEKLQAAAQKRQLALDTVAQASSIITSSIQIIQGFSKIPVVGLGLGIAAVAALLGFFAKTKIDAFNAVKLSSGADRIDDYFGFGDRYGNTDLAGGKGYRLVNAANGKPTNVVISGREMLLPESLSLKNEAFFNKLKSGAYDHIDLSQAIDMHKTYKSSTAPIIIQQKQEKQRQFIPGKNGKYHLVTITPDMKDGTTIEIQ